MERIKFLALLLALPLMAQAQFTYVSTSTQTSASIATFNVSAGNFVVVSVIGGQWVSSPSTLTDSAGNVYTNRTVPGGSSPLSVILTTWYMGCAPQTLYSNLNQTWYYGFATNSGVGVTVTDPTSYNGAPYLQHIEAQVFSTTYAYAQMDSINSLSDFYNTTYFASPQSTTPANSNEIWVTTAFQLNSTLTTAAATATATTALTAIGGTSWNSYSTPSGAQTFTYPSNSASTCPLPPNLAYDSYVTWFSTLGFKGSLTPPVTTQTHVQTLLGD